jgi:hypothetical protein
MKMRAVTPVPVALAREHPHLTGIGFDLRQVQPAFEAFVMQQGLAQTRVKHLAGSDISGSNRW